MTIRTHIRSNVDYGRTLVRSGWKGAREGAQASAPVSSVLAGSARSSWLPAVMGACIGVLAGTLIHKRKSPYILGLVSGLAGGALGFTTGMAWGTRRLTGGMARGAARNIGVVRDGRWLSKNPIDYA